MAKAQLNPLHDILGRNYMTIIESVYTAYDILAIRHEEATQSAINIFKGLKSGDLSLDQLQITDDAWDIMPADMVVVPKNGNKPAKEAKNAVPAASS